MSDSLRTMDCIIRGFPVLHQLPELAQTHPLSWRCHPTISFFVIPFSSYLQSFPASGSLLMSQLFVSGGPSIGVSASASVLSMNVQDWFPLRLIGLISLLSKGLSGVFSRTSVRRHQFFGIQPSLIIAAAAKLLQSCPTLCDPIDGSPPGSSVPGIL